ncbi:hypothetical protein KC356_g217 [Hortaea werneckii]|nr:hypothetical protein KC356_g217 [Hortaea werneckii]
MLYSCLPRLARLESKWYPASDVVPDADLFRSAVAGGGPVGSFLAGRLDAYPVPRVCSFAQSRRFVTPRYVCDELVCPRFLLALSTSCSPAEPAACAPARACHGRTDSSRAPAILLVCTSHGRYGGQASNPRPHMVRVGRSTSTNPRARRSGPLTISLWHPFSLSSRCMNR